MSRKVILIKQELLLLVYELNRSRLLAENVFFNDTATTEIYTLSLHDALPISASASVRLYCSSTPALRSASLRVRYHTFSEADRKDRKSTRLNSSHLVISYAVFCLKKIQPILAQLEKLLLSYFSPSPTDSVQTY